MIPAPVPALTGLAVLVTRPEAQADSLCRRIEAAGGEAVALPAVVIEPLAQPVLVSTDPAPGPRHYDIVIFVSTHAVACGLQAVPRDLHTRIAAIGRATAAALVRAGVEPAIVPEKGFTSEALLAHPAMQSEAIRHVLIVRGGAGRDVLENTLTARGIEVDYLEVYRRVPPSPDPAAIAALVTRWTGGGIDVVTVTSSEILHNLRGMLDDRGNRLLCRTPLIVVSPRLGALARDLGCAGEILVAPAGDDDTLVGTLALWRTRARAVP